MKENGFISILIAIITSLGGFTFIHHLMNRRWEKQKLTAENIGIIEETGRRQIDWLEKRITERDSRIESIFQELRKEQKNTIDLLRRLHELRMRLREAHHYRCERMGCPSRIRSDNSLTPDNSISQNTTDSDNKNITKD